ncbi:MAG: TRAP transporter small permease [Methylobacteriaceae bacterium]|nr:TRAP transporter small permease [Methylobacteriaceae bacterium]
MAFLRRPLDAAYLVAGYVAAACMVALLLVIVLQMAARWTGAPFPGSSEYAGYLMASSSFLAFAHALNGGAHIRVGLMLNALGRWRWIGEIWCFAIGTAASSYVAFYAVKLVWWSWKLGDVSQGQDETPLWIPQAPFAFGAVLFAICFIDNLLTILATRRDNIRVLVGTPLE